MCSRRIYIGIKNHYKSKTPPFFLKSLIRHPDELAKPTAFSQRRYTVKLNRGQEWKLQSKVSPDNMCPVQQMMFLL